ncbi:hypothetical protein OG948_59520 (plasmid) [Embleya sp. NBC_00888]|uniref:hypothetical protein n=1 Tax=Embleya sp. NBC_00888 TaxID=2975960 RepID=UPI002F916B0D|nr:hypothetical protein OG948_59520 [Embleya sp. NBC_00888]
MAYRQPFRAGDLVEAVVVSTPPRPRPVRLRLDRDPWPSTGAGTLVVCDATSATVVRADTLRRVKDDAPVTATSRIAARPPDRSQRSVTEERHTGDTRADRSER